jgi:hypothetical protein
MNKRQERKYRRLAEILAEDGSAGLDVTTLARRLHGREPTCRELAATEQALDTMMRAGLVKGYPIPEGKH